MRALSLGNLRASRDNLGRWHIDPVVLDDWLSMRTPVRHSPSTRADTDVDSSTVTLDTPVDTALDTLRDERDEARLEAAAVRAEAAQLRDRLGEAQGYLDDARAERDRWRAMAERLVEREAEHPPEPQPRSSFLVRFLGQGRSRPA